MQAKRAELITYICGFAFLLGGMSGCLTGFLCSEEAQNHLTSCFLSWNISDVIIACFAAELLMAVFALILSLAPYSYIMLTLLDTLFGYCFGLALFFIIQSNAAFAIHGLLFCSFIPDTFVLLHLSVLSSEISKRNTQVWTSTGMRIFDLKFSLQRIWAELFILFIVFAIRFILFT